ncbi:MAG: histidine kinase [Bacteroidales bacterium]
MPQTLNNIIKGKTIYLHGFILFFSFIVGATFSISNKGTIFSAEMLDILILLSIQLELFFGVSVAMFGKLKLSTDRKELTRTALSRFALFFLICFVIALIVIVVYVITISLFRQTDPQQAVRLFFENKFAGWVKQTTGGLLFGAAIFIFIQWQDALKREQELREKNLVFQNETLKSQVNPHFLFNNFNTLASLIQANPEVAETFVKKLSSIYRYILENGQRDRVSLQSELAFISDYYFLYKIRDEEKIRLEIDVNERGKYFILPVSLQILVENAIKHNMATRQQPLVISVKMEDGHVIVSNNLQKMASGIRSTGIGLRNLSERVRLTTRKELVIEETNDRFTVKLPLL